MNVPILVSYVQKTKTCLDIVISNGDKVTKNKVKNKDKETKEG